MVVIDIKTCYDLMFPTCQKKLIRKKIRVSLIEFPSVFRLLLEEKP